MAEPIIKLAGELMERHALRAYDAIQLASADERLLAAASSEGLTTQQVSA